MGRSSLRPPPRPIDRGDDQGWNGPRGEHWAAHVHRHEAGFRHLTPQLLAAVEIEPAHAVLDVGCGAGASTLLAAAAANDGGHALGVDISVRLIAVARCRAAAARAENARFHCAEAAGYPFELGSFDRVVSQFGLEHLADPADGIANLARAMRPGGRLAFLCWQSPEMNAWRRIPLEAITRHVPHAAALKHNDGPGPFALADPERISALLHGAHLGDVRITGIEAPMWLGHTVADAAEYLLSSPDIRTLLASADPAGAAEAGRALTEALTPFRGEGGLELGCAAWLVTATR